MLCPCCGRAINPDALECVCSGRFVGEPPGRPMFRVQSLGPAMTAVTALVVIGSLSVWNLWSALGIFLVAIVAGRALRLSARNPLAYGGYRTAATVLAISLVGGACLTGYGLGRIPHIMHKRKLRGAAATAGSLYELQTVLEAHKSKYGSYPITEDALKKFAGKPLPTDAWDQAIAYSSSTKDVADARLGPGIQLNNFQLRSAGPDGKIGSDDDIVMEDGIIYSNPNAVESPIIKKPMVKTSATRR